MVMCAVYGCRTKSCKSNGGERINFHLFPKDLEIKKLWTVLCRRSWDVGNGFSKICSKHFTNDQYDIKSQLVQSIGYKHKTNSKLKKDAIPMIFEAFDFRPKRKSTECIRKEELRNQDDVDVEMPTLERSDLDDIPPTERSCILETEVDTASEELPLLDQTLTGNLPPPVSESTMWGTGSEGTLELHDSFNVPAETTVVEIEERSIAGPELLTSILEDTPVAVSMTVPTSEDTSVESEAIKPEISHLEVLSSVTSQPEPPSAQHWLPDMYDSVKEEKGNDTEKYSSPNQNQIYETTSNLDVSMTVPTPEGTSVQPEAIKAEISHLEMIPSASNQSEPSPAQNSDSSGPEVRKQECPKCNSQNIKISDLQHMKKLIRLCPLGIYTKEEANTIGTITLPWPELSSESENMKIKERPNMAKEQPKVVKEWPNVDKERLNVVEERPNVVEERPNVVKERPNVVKERPNVVKERPHVIIIENKSISTQADLDTEWDTETVYQRRGKRLVNRRRSKRLVNKKKKKKP